jgi:hypothetical protein
MEKLASTDIISAKYDQQGITSFVYLCVQDMFKNNKTLN